MDPRLLIVGHMNLDHISTPTGEAEERPGGGALYTAYAAGIYGNEVDLLATCCSDMPHYCFDDMKQQHINSENILHILGRQRRSSMSYNSDLVRTNHAHKSKAWYDASVAQVPRHLPLADHPYAMMYLAPMFGENQYLYAKYAKETGLPVAMDVSEYYANEDQEHVKLALSCVDIFMPSDIELYELYPEAEGDLRKTVEAVRNAGVKVLIIKQSVRGCLVCDLTHDLYFRVGINKVENVIDATGAGDTFNGGFLSCYLATGDPLFSARYASVVSSICIRDFSFYALIGKKREDVLAFVDNVSFFQIPFDQVD